MRAFSRMLAQAARSDLPVLLQGESGTGKPMHARALHAMSARAAGPFICVECPAAPSELERRAEEALEGVLFLHEIARLDPVAQAATLGILDGRLCATHRPAVRVVASSTQDLGAPEMGPRFRRDLFYRLSVLELRVPPLRERREDIPAIAAEILARIARSTGAPVTTLTLEVEQLLARYAWPGNLTELESVLERLMILGADGIASVDALPDRIRAGAPSARREGEQS